MNNMLLLVILNILFKVILASIIEEPQLPNLRNRIIGGEAVDIEDRPYQVSVQFEGKHHCGGSIISKDYILTAGHCIRQNKGLALYTIRYGSKYHMKGGSLANITKILQHPIYKDYSHDYDMALIKLKDPLKFNFKCQPVKLPKKTLTIPDGSSMIVSGWGVTGRDKSEFNKELHAVDVVKINDDLCRKAYEAIHKITPAMICAGHKGSPKDACVGDSGGPLSLNGVQVGVVSWGRECANADFPGVYAKVTPMRDWIRKITGS